MWLYSMWLYSMWLYAMFYLAMCYVDIYNVLCFQRHPTLSILTWVSESDGENRVERRATITVLDVNDEIPTFTQQTYKITTPEVNNIM